MSNHKASKEKREALGQTGHVNIGRYRAMRRVDEPPPKRRTAAEQVKDAELMALVLAGTLGRRRRP